MDEGFDWVRLLISIIVMLFVVVFVSVFLAGLYTSHTRDDIKVAVVEHLNTQYDLSDDTEFIQESDLIVLENKSRVMTFVMDETVFVADYSVEHNHFSENEITVKSIQQIKHEVNIGSGG